MRCFQLSKGDSFGDGVLSIGGEHIGWRGEWILNNPRFISREFFNSMSSGRIRKSDILLVKDGATIGKVAIATTLPAEEAAVNEHVFILRVTPENDSKYYFYFMQSPLAQDQIQLEIRGSAQPGLNSELRNVLIAPRPSLDVQRAIADYLDHETARIDALIAAKERLLALLAEKRRALITRAVTRGLDPHAPMRDSGIPWLGEIPAHWEVKHAKFLFTQSALPVFENDEIVTCFRDGEVTLRQNRRLEGFTQADLEQGYQGVRQGQLVIHSMDAFAGAIGVSDSDGKCSPEYIICDPRDESVDNYYYSHLLRTMALSGFIQASCPAVRERAPRIRFSEFGDMKMPLPPLDEQRAIVEHITKETARLDALRATTERSIALLEERRAALISAAVTGQIEVSACAASTADREAVP